MDKTESVSDSAQQIAVTIQELRFAVDRIRCAISMPPNGESRPAFDGNADLVTTLAFIRDEARLTLQEAVRVEEILGVQPIQMAPLMAAKKTAPEPPAFSSQRR